MSQSEDSLIKEYQRLYLEERGIVLSEPEAAEILAALGDILLLADISEGGIPPPL